MQGIQRLKVLVKLGFNPLERGNLNQIAIIKKLENELLRFQSPRTGKFESNEVLVCFMFLPTIQFQSPRSGKFESNARVSRARHRYPRRFNPLDRGNLNQIQTQIE